MKKNVRLSALLLAILFLVTIMVACSAPAETESEPEQSISQTTETTEETQEEPTVDFPTGTITLIVPYGAGGGTDISARALAAAAEKQLGQTVVVQNVSGGSGVTGFQQMMSNPADGYTVLVGTGGYVSVEMLGLAPEDFKLSEQSQPVMLFNEEKIGLMVKADSPYETLEDFITAANEAPGEVILATTGSGTSQHLAALMFAKESESEFLTVPYQEGAAQVVTALLGGHAHACIVQPAEVSGYLESGEMRMLAVASKTKSDAYPDSPTFEELGYNVVLDTWRGVFTPADVPQEVVDILEKAFLAACEDTDFIEVMNNGSFTIKTANAQEFNDVIELQYELIGGIVDIYNESQS